VPTAFLASDEAKDVTDVTLPVDAGFNDRCKDARAVTLVACLRFELVWTVAESTVVHGVARETCSTTVLSALSLQLVDTLGSRRGQSLHADSGNAEGRRAREHVDVLVAHERISV